MSTGVVQAASFLNPLCLGGESTQNTRSGTNEPNFYSVKPKKTNPNEPISKPFLSQSNPKFRLLEIPTQGEAEGHRAATRGARAAIFVNLRTNLFFTKLVQPGLDSDHPATRVVKGNQSKSRVKNEAEHTHTSQMINDK